MGKQYRRKKMPYRNNKQGCLAELPHLLRILWAICTFGYSYPRKRAGENDMVCILRTVVVLVVRFSCIMGAVWYLSSWIWYVQKGDSRPFSILQHESEQGDTKTPSLRIYSTEIGKLNVTGLYYNNKTGPSPQPVEKHVRYNQTWVAPGDEMVTVQPPCNTLNGHSMDFLQIEIHHSAPLPSYSWTQLSLVHPDAVDPNSKNHTSRDLLNHYYFLPGHFVEVRYTPLQFYTVYKPNENTTTLEHFISFLGFKEKVPNFSYQSTVEHIPFPKGWYNNMTTVIVLRPQSTIEVITYQDEKRSFKDTMAKIGGLMGFVSSVLVFLFGASLLSPWGFIAGIPCFRRRITNSLAEAYYSPDSSGPFTIKSNNIGRFDSRHTSAWRMIKLLKQRVDELELVLSDYYVDTSVFQHFSEVRRKVKRRKTWQTLAVASRTQGNSQHQCPTGSLTQPCQALPRSYDHHSRYRFHISRPLTILNPLCGRDNTSSATRTISVLEQGHQMQDLPQQEYVQQLQHSSTPSPSHAISQCIARPSWQRNSGVSGAGVGYVFVPMSEDCDLSHISDLCKESATD